jgi:hypothetical protein
MWYFIVVFALVILKHRLRLVVYNEQTPVNFVFVRLLMDIHIWSIGTVRIVDEIECSKAKHDREKHTWLSIGISDFISRKRHQSNGRIRIAMPRFNLWLHVCQQLVTVDDSQTTTKKKKMTAKQSAVMNALYFMCSCPFAWVMLVSSFY